MCLQNGSTTFALFNRGAKQAKGAAKKASKTAQQTVRQVRLALHTSIVSVSTRACQAVCRH